MPMPGSSLLVSAERAARLREEARDLPSIELTVRQVFDLELLINGGFSPLDGYLDAANLRSVLAGIRLVDGTLWPLPICLDIAPAVAELLAAQRRVALRHPEGQLLAVLSITELFAPNRAEEAEQIFGTLDPAHPGVDQLLHRTQPVYVGGSLEGVELPLHHTFAELRHDPQRLRGEFAQRGFARVVAFQTRNPLHRAHVEMIRRAAGEDLAVLLHPVVGPTRPGDIDAVSRVRCYRAVLPHLPQGRSMLSLLPLAMRMAGPREALWHALIRRNFGCSHFIVGRDHAGPGADAHGKPFYAPYAAQELVQRHEAEAGIRMLAFEEQVYVADRRIYLSRSELAPGEAAMTLSGTELRDRLRTGAEIPEWFSYPEVVAELRRSHPPRHELGFTVFFTGLSGAGKSTIAQVLLAKLIEHGGRPVTLLDGDIVRKHLSSELGFSKEHRDLNIRRIGFVASEITKNRGAAICAPIAPYAAVRREVREAIEEHGAFIEVFVATPLEVCEKRDRKGLYAKARAGILRGFTGIDDPYEAPQLAEVVIDTTQTSAEAAAEQILAYLRSGGYVAANPQ